MMDEKNKLFTTHLFIFMVGRREVFNILDIHDIPRLYSRSKAPDFASLTDIKKYNNNIPNL